MKSWWIASSESGTTIELRDMPVPQPKPNELLVRVRAAALNRGEFIGGAGLHAGADAKPGGIEAAGEVVEIGAQAVGFAPGDRVMGRASPGFAEFALFDASEAVRVPDRLSWSEAAGATVVYLTAYDMLYPGGALQRGEWLLVTGASAGVGVASIQIAKLIAARTIGTSGDEAKLARLRALGLDVGLCTRRPDFAERVRLESGGKGVDLVVNNVGGSVFAECLRALAYRGRLATVGYVDGVLAAEIDLGAVHAKRLKLFGVSNKMRTAAERAEATRGFVRDVLPAIADGRIRPIVDRVFAFDALPQAKAHMEANAHLGKIVVTL